MPLQYAEIGRKNTISKIYGSSEIKNFLENLGFIVGGEVIVISSIGGNVIVKVKEARVAISEEMAKKNNDSLGGKKMRTLREAQIGETVMITKLNGTGAVKRRMMDMGMTKGTTVFIRKKAPLGDPLEVTVRGYELSIRKVDAEMIEIQ